MCCIERVFGGITFLHSGRPSVHLPAPASYAPACPYTPACCDAARRRPEQRPAGAADAAAAGGAAGPHPADARDDRTGSDAGPHPGLDAEQRHPHRTTGSTTAASAAAAAAATAPAAAPAAARRDPYAHPWLPPPTIDSPATDPERCAVNHLYPPQLSGNPPAALAHLQNVLFPANQGHKQSPLLQQVMLLAQNGRLSPEQMGMLKQAVAIKNGAATGQSLSPLLRE